jgi:hypothetical protein
MKATPDIQLHHALRHVLLAYPDLRYLSESDYPVRAVCIPAKMPARYGLTPLLEGKKRLCPADVLRAQAEAHSDGQGGLLYTGAVGAWLLLLHWFSQFESYPQVVYRRETGPCQYELLLVAEFPAVLVGLSTTVIDS